jgi:hypothetical protein
MTVAYPQSSRNGLAGVIQTRCNAGAGGPRLYLGEAGASLPSTGILGFVELADFGAPADGVTISPSNGNIGSATGSGTIAVGIYADSDGNECHRTDEVGLAGSGAEIILDKLDVLAGDRIKLLADVSYTSSLSSPLQVRGLLAHWEGPLATGFGTSGFQVPDLSGNAFHATQATPSLQPAVTATALDFVAGGRFLEMAAARPHVALATRAAFVLQFESLVNVVNGGRILRAGTAATTDERMALDFGPRGSTVAGAFGSVNNVAQATPVFDNANPHVLTVALEQTDLRFYTDGAQNAQFSVTAGRWPDLSVLRFSDPSGSFAFTGRLKRIFAVTGVALTATERRFLETYQP